MDPDLSPLFPQSLGREKMFLPLNEMIVSVIYSGRSLHPSVRSVMISADLNMNATLDRFQ